MRDASAPAEDGTPAPRLAARAPRFQPPRATRGGPDRRLGLFLSVGLHVLLFVVLLVTNAVRMPDLASLLDEPAAGGRGESVVYLPIDAFPGPRTSATPGTPAPIAAAPLRVPAAAPREATPITGRAPAQPAPVAPVPGAPGDDDRAGAGSGGGSGAGAGTAAARFNRAVEALRPRALDPRLRPGSLDALRTDHERAALRAYVRIRALNDSIMAEIAAGQRATDWTWTDGDGRRWGISPGKLHLGGIEIPLPITTAGSDAQRELVREWQEIQAQAEQGEIDETFDDRVEAIRARRDAERREE